MLRSIPTAPLPPDPRLPGRLCCLPRRMRFRFNRLGIAGADRNGLRLRFLPAFVRFELARGLRPKKGPSLH